jgi:hypothetical protein
MATEVIELAAPPPSSTIDNSGEEQAVTEATVSRVVLAAGQALRRRR